MLPGRSTYKIKVTCSNMCFTQTDLGIHTYQCRFLQDATLKEPTPEEEHSPSHEWVLPTKDGPTEVVIKIATHRNMEKEKDFKPRLTLEVHFSACWGKTLFFPCNAGIHALV